MSDKKTRTQPSTAIPIRRIPLFVVIISAALAFSYALSIQSSFTAFQSQEPSFKGRIEALYLVDTSASQGSLSSSEPIESLQDTSPLPPDTLVWVAVRLDPERSLFHAVGQGADVRERIVALVWLQDVPQLSVGDRVRASASDFPSPYAPPHPDDRYGQVIDFERSQPLLILLALFAAVVISVGRWWGLRSLIGLAFSLFVVVRFVIPGILSGASPPLVAWAGATIIMLVTLYVSHGASQATTIAAASIVGSLAATVLLGVLFVDYARISGLASDSARDVVLFVGGVDMSGLALAGLIVASLGVLDDVTVSQVSTVTQLKRSDPSLSSRELFVRAMHVGRDHIAAVVNTLFLAYAGASLAALVLFTTSGLPAWEIASSDLVAEEIVKTLVGSIGLVLAVPLATFMAAFLGVPDRTGDQVDPA